MASPWACTLLCLLLAGTLARAALRPTAILSLSPDIIREKLMDKLEEHNATVILQQLPLLSTVQEESTGLLGSLLSGAMNHIIWFKVTSASILQLQVQPLYYSQEMLVRIPMDMMAGFNTPLVKTILQMHLETEAQATIQVETGAGTPPRLVIGDCSSNHRNLRISVLNKLSFLVNSLAEKVTNILTPALPSLVQDQLCPVIEAAFNDMYANLLHLVTEPAVFNLGSVQFYLQTPVIDGDIIQLNLGATLLDSEKKVSKWFNQTTAFLTAPTLDSAPVKFTVRHDLVNAVVAALLPPEEFVVLLDYVVPNLADQLKLAINTFNKEVGPFAVASGPRVGLMSMQAAGQVEATQRLKIRTLKSPEVVLNHDGARVAQQIVLDFFANEQTHRPLFTLGIEADSEAEFYSSRNQFMLNFQGLNSDRIHLMNSGIAPFNPDLLKDAVSNILASVLIPNQNGKLRPGIKTSMMKALGFQEVTWSMTQPAGLPKQISVQLTDLTLNSLDNMG
ncbi:BPI fold-containing family B member 1 [Ochotona curzoniae]|uniref:BPI fold-containing family B member 1 n=1 Tax=Ochotona curzoniae TaxID=130825 RepID=UPI001B34EC31|nr:BPI fold-containing family B member 1 [Ochotona curzoniae]